MTDPDEAAFLVAQARHSVLTSLPPLGPKARYDELALYAELAVDRTLRGSRIAVIDEPCTVAARHGARSGVVYLTCTPTGLPAHTHDRYTGAVVSGWRHTLTPPASFVAPEIAHAALPVPGTLAELHDQFTANTVQLAEPSHVLAVGDVVVPPLYGAQALTIHIPAGVNVRALAGCAGHNQFQVTHRYALHAA